MAQFYKIFQNEGGGSLITLRRRPLPRLLQRPEPVGAKDSSERDRVAIPREGPQDQRPALHHHCLLSTRWLIQNVAANSSKLQPFRTHTALKPSTPIGVNYLTKWRRFEAPSLAKVASFSLSDRQSWRNSLRVYWRRPRLRSFSFCAGITTSTRMS